MEIYILDSGVRASHVDFSDENFGTSRVEDGYNFIDNTGSVKLPISTSSLLRD